ncbi:hypothetical protein HY768_10360 [candidate division TA06 bacterium]|uniref:Uncharacterized protein n=1 Tax=candidate division TA06 bacterium TaxID=2250710 RepID=A0A933IDX7_UNCT6|nr:hypothetical protein [candidate division TA06 bacterium]
MLTEDSVIDAVCSMLKEHGYEIQQITKGRKPGDDIIAIKQGNPTRQLIIEAKGETSGENESKNYGKPFESADIRVNTAEALYKAAEVLSRKIEGHKIFMVAEAIEWRKVELNPQKAKKLSQNGYTPEILGKYLHYNISEKSRIELEKQGSKGIEDMRTLLYGNIYNLQGRCFEFVGQRLQSLSKTTALYAVGENIYFLDFGNSSAPYVVQAAVQVFSTYTYVTNMGTINKIPWLVVLSYSGSNF